MAEGEGALFTSQKKKKMYSRRHTIYSPGIFQTRFDARERDRHSASQRNKAGQTIFASPTHDDCFYSHNWTF